MTKVNEVVAANPGVSIDDLVSSRKINADQKAQLLKKPALQSQLAQLEEQLAQYKKFEQEFQSKISQEKEILSKTHSEEVEKLRDILKAEAALEQKKVLREKFLTLSRFLRAAAARRQLEEDDSDLTKAFEGALLLVYGGDATAVAAVEKLIDGTEDSVPSTEGAALSVTCRSHAASLTELVLNLVRCPD
jgi:ribosomal protein L16 Arg81 hydroxylase